MGIMARREGDTFVITSDRTSHAETTKRAPRVSLVCQVWTGAHWSRNTNTAMRFGSCDAADEYLRANFARVIA